MYKFGRSHNSEKRLFEEDKLKMRISNSMIIFRENEIVSIEVGKYADFIVIDMDIFNIDPIDIEKTNVLMTFFDGRIVYESKN